MSDYDCDEMEECTDDYVSFAMEQIEKAKHIKVFEDGTLLVVFLDGTRIECKK